MNRAEKGEFINEVRETIGNAGLVILTDFQGASVLELDRFRRGVEKSGASFRVVKNSLCRLALVDSPKAALSEYFRGNVGVVTAGEDAVAAAKAFRTLVKENDKIKVRIGFFDGDVLDAKAVDAVADLPSREDILGRLLATIEESPRQLLRVLQAPARDLVFVLQNYATKLEESGS
jgi:large subunit ribosomal protein L10